MVNHKKRGLILISAFLALVFSILLFAFNGVICASRILEKLADDPEAATLLEGFPILEDVQVFIDMLYDETITSMLPINLFPAINDILIAVGVIGIVLAIKQFKKPLKADGSVTYRGWVQFFTFLISVVVLVANFLAISAEGFADAINNEELNVMIQYICFAFMGLAGLSIVFEIISIFMKKNCIYAKTLVKPNYKQDVALSVLGVEEKLKKVQQLKDVGVINEAQYNAAVIRIINGI